MATRRILLIDDDANITTVLADLFGDSGWDSVAVGNSDEAFSALSSRQFDLAMVDLSLPGMDGLSLLREIKEIDPEMPAIMMTGYASVQSAISAMKFGAYDYITKPFDLDQVEMVVKRAIERRHLVDENSYLREQLRLKHGFDGIVGMNPRIQQAYVLASQVADSNASVLILGETGTGKEYLARSIHYKSSRSEGPFIKVSCAALPESLLESELFGHEKGAFTNAIARRIGRFELADGGTLFLDELGDMSLTTQLKLLRVLQEKEFERVGGSETIKVDVRIISATNRDLKEAMADKHFREDLYYRLNVVTITVPPLRERSEDIPELVRHFISKYNEETAKRIEGISPEGMEMLMGYSWSGNIRELENCVERAVILCNGHTILPRHLLIGESETMPVTDSETHDLRSLSQVEREHIERVLTHCEGNQTRAASILGIDRKTLRNKVKEYQLPE